jgi:hypothetical protein
MQIITDIARSVGVWSALLAWGMVVVVRSDFAIVSAHPQPSGQH